YWRVHRAQAGGRRTVESVAAAGRDAPGGNRGLAGAAKSRAKRLAAAVGWVAAAIERGAIQALRVPPHGHPRRRRPEAPRGRGLGGRCTRPYKGYRAIQMYPAAKQGVKSG